MTNRDRLQELKSAIDGAGGAMGVLDLKVAVTEVLNVPGPNGDPGRLQQYSRVYDQAGRTAEKVHQRVLNVASRGLPIVWTGTAGEGASDVVRAVGNNLDDSATALQEASREMRILAEELAEAQQLHGSGLHPLIQAQGMLSDIEGLDGIGEFATWAHDVMEQAKPPAQQGVSRLYRAAVAADEAYHRFVRQLNQYAAETTAGQLTGSGLTSLEQIVLSEAAVPGAGNEENILSSVDVSRASAAMDALSDDDRARFEALLDDAKSPQEAAYLLKALAAGYSLDDVTRFDELIHPYGDDLGWLRDRLSPGAGLSDESRGVEVDVEFDGRDWTQGEYPTCVAASTITARAMVDPIYSLLLTTGGRPGDPEFDSGDAFAERLRWQQQVVYDGARPEYDDWPLVGSSGMNEGESRDVANSLIGERTGSLYMTMGLDSENDRRNALPAIEHAVANGYPVPVAIRGGGDGHQVVIVGHDGDRLEIYNPWGFTVWVSEWDFVNSNMGIASQRSGGPDEQLDTR